ncbi:MAG: hypothetical protein ABF290_12735 [Thiogranum sp.]
MLQAFDTEWFENNSESWATEHRRISENSRRIAELREKPLEAMENSQLWELATLTGESDPDVDVLPLYRAYADRVPDDSDASFVLGIIMLERGDRNGLDYLRKALDYRALAFPACDIAINFLAERDEDYTWWQDRYDEHTDKETAAVEERTMTSVDDTFFMPELPPDWLEPLIKPLDQNNEIQHAWLAQREVRQFPDSPFWVMVIKKRGVFIRGQAVLNWLVEEYQVPFETLFLMDNGANRAVTNEIKKVAFKLL